LTVIDKTALYRQWFVIQAPIKAGLTVIDKTALYRQWFVIQAPIKAGLTVITSIDANI
jgi:hypothetical protein